MAYTPTTYTASSTNVVIGEGLSSPSRPGISCPAASEPPATGSRCYVLGCRDAVLPTQSRHRRFGLVNSCIRHHPSRG
jgi:hypothetical protein